MCVCVCIRLFCCPLTVFFFDSSAQFDSISPPSGAICKERKNVIFRISPPPKIVVWGWSLGLVSSISSPSQSTTPAVRTCFTASRPQSANPARAKGMGWLVLPSLRTLAASPSRGIGPDLRTFTDFMRHAPQGEFCVVGGGHPRSRERVHLERHRDWVLADAVCRIKRRQHETQVLQFIRGFIESQPRMALSCLKASILCCMV